MVAAKFFTQFPNNGSHREKREKKITVRVRRKKVGEGKVGIQIKAGVLMKRAEVCLVVRGGGVGLS